MDCFLFNVTNWPLGSRKTNPFVKVSMGKIVINPAFTEEGSGGSNNKKIEVADDVMELAEDEQSDIEETKEDEASSEETTEPLDQETKEEVVEEEAESTEPTKIKIGEMEYSEEELQTIVARGSKIKEWEKKMPGFDIDKFMPDYTRKSQRLAELEKRTAPKEKKANDLKTLGIDEDQVKAFETVAEHLGFVRQTDLVKDSVDAQKEAFLSRHADYKAKTPVSDAKWESLMQEFNLYNWQGHPHRVEEFLEEAHRKVSATWQETDRGEKMKESITTKKAQVQQATGGGGKTASAPKKAEQPNAAAKYRAMGWSEEDIKDLLT